MLRVSIPNWVPIAQLNSISEILTTEVRLVGGCVRDILQNKVSKDIDLASALPPEVALQKLHVANIKALATGLKYGTITILMPPYSFELTTLRMDTNSDGRHAEVQYIDDWRIDASRRDFTINAMSLDLQGVVYDFFGGYQDLKQGIIRFVGDPAIRIIEDKLRMLRLFRFYAYLDNAKVDKESLNATLKSWQGIASLSGERIKQEMMRLLTAPHALQAIQLMLQYQLLITLNINNIPLQQLTNFSFSSEFIPNLAALLVKAQQKDLHLLSKQWRFSNKEAALLKFLVNTNFRFNKEDISHQEIIYRTGIEKATLLLQMQLVIDASLDKHREALYKYLNEYRVPKFPINGYMLQELGYQNKEIALCMENLKEKWIASGFNLSLEALLKNARQMKC